VFGPMKMGMRLCSVIAGAAVCMGARVSFAQSAPSGANQQSSSDQSSLTLQVYSRLTVVDVTVMNGKGEPVHGLKATDFTIEEDGKPQPIRSFQEIGKDTPPVARTLPKLPPNVYTNLQPPPNTSAVNILLLDALNTPPSDQVFVKDEAVRYLKGMPPGTRIAILGLSNRLRILQGFTSDPAILMAAINTKKNRQLPSPFMDTDTGDMIDSLMDVVDSGTAASLAEFENEQSTFQADMRNRMTLEALNQIAAYVAGIKGRKNLIWFSSGMPLTIFPTGGLNDLQGMTDYSKDLRKTTDLLTAAQVAVYPIDARGLFNNPANSAVNAGSGFASGKGNSMAVKNLAFDMKTGQELLSMEAVAEATGGVAYYNTNGLKEAVGKAIENGSNYYTISYVPPSLAYDGAFHNLSVKVNEKGLHLAYRKGYYADDISNNAITPGLTLATTAPEPYGSNMAASMGRGVPTSSQILFTVNVQPHSADLNSSSDDVKGILDPKLKGKALRRYDLQYSLPARQITFAQEPKGTRKGSLEFDVAAYDVYGKLITSLSQSINLPITAEQYQKLAGTPFRFFQQVDLPPGEMFIRVGVLDVGSDHTGTLELPLTVTKKSEPPTQANGGANQRHDAL
jgi:VWFA-related protein